MSIARFQISLNNINKWDLEVIEDGSVSTCCNIGSKSLALEIAQAYCYDNYGFDILFEVVRSTRTHIIYDAHSKQVSRLA